MTIDLLSIYFASSEGASAPCCILPSNMSNLFGLKSTGLRFFTVYGPWGRPDMAMYIFAEKIFLSSGIEK